MIESIWLSTNRSTKRTNLAFRSQRGIRVRDEFVKKGDKIKAKHRGQKICLSVSERWYVQLTVQKVRIGTISLVSLREASFLNICLSKRETVKQDKERCQKKQICVTVLQRSSRVVRELVTSFTESLNTHFMPFWLKGKRRCNKGKELKLAFVHYKLQSTQTSMTSLAVTVVVEDVVPHFLSLLSEAKLQTKMLPLSVLDFTSPI